SLACAHLTLSAAIPQATAYSAGASGALCYGYKSIFHMGRPMSERRRYFRIDDYVELAYLCVDRDTLTNTRPESLFPDAALLNLQAEFKKIDSESAQLLFQIKDL